MSIERRAASAAPCATLMKPLLLSLFVTGIFCASSSTAAEPSPRDPVSAPHLSGFLDNGLAYSIDHITSTPGKVDIALIVRVGSNFETPDTLEYPHLLEHMLIEGVADREQKGSLAQQIARLSPARGTRTNGFTFPQQTIYAMEVFPKDDAALAAAFDIVHGWSSGLGLNEGALARGRAAIVEEFRLSPGVIEQWKRHRLVGIDWLDPSTAAVMKSLDRATMAKMQGLYDRWYIPGRMIVTVRGDVNPAHARQLIARKLGGLPSGVLTSVRLCPPQRLDGKRHVRAIEGIRGSTTGVTIRFRRHGAQEGAGLRGRSRLVAQLANEMIAARLRSTPATAEGLTETTGANLAEALPCGLVDSQLMFAARSGAVKESFLEYYRLLATLKMFGFDTVELDAAKQVLAAQPTETFIDNLLAGDDVGGHLATIALSEVNDALADWLSSNTRYVVISPSKDDISVTQADVEAWMDEVDAARPTRWSKPVEKIAPELTMTAPEDGPRPIVQWLDGGSARAEFPDARLTLLVDTDASAQRIRFHAQRSGGFERGPASNKAVATIAAEAIAAAGVANLDALALRQWERRRDVRVTPFIDAWREGLYADAASDRLEDLLAASRAWLTQSDYTEPAWRQYQSLLITGKSNENPRRRFDRQVASLIKASGAADPLEIDFSQTAADDLLSAYQQHLGSVGGFVISISGPVDAKRTIDLVGRYLATLPSDPAPAAIPRREEYVTGPLTTTIAEGPPDEAQVRYYIFGRPAAGLPSAADFEVLADALNARLFTRLRERENGTYDVIAGAAGLVETGEFGISVAFNCAPENAQSLVRAVSDEFDRLRTDGFTAEEHALFARSEVVSLTPRQRVERALLARDFPDAVRRPTLQGERAIDALRSYLDPQKAMVFIQLPAPLVRK